MKTNPVSSVFFYSESGICYFFWDFLGVLVFKDIWGSLDYNIILVHLI